MSDDRRENHDDLIRALQDNFRREREGGALYRHLAGLEENAAKKKIFQKLAEAEDRHSQRWAARLKELGALPPKDSLGFQARCKIRLARWLGLDNAVRRQEAAEDRDIGIYEKQMERYANEVGDIITEIRDDERKHSRFLNLVRQEAGPQTALDAILKRERWHHFGRGWVSDAIYGANDGLGAVFGLVAGVAGYTNTSHWILVSGLAGTVSSALSMAAGAYLAAKSSRELAEAELSREKGEFEENPEEEHEELELIYQLKGFTEAESKTLVEKLSARPEQFMKTMAAEELGISDVNESSPVHAAWSAGLSTAVGAIVPVLPFFWLEGVTAIVVAAAVSMAAHFAVGAAKSLITIRRWWTSGLEMTAVGALEGGVTYLLGVAAGKLL
jgi:VIT1/CCC1 family predicted Fe2+/Mn2+ transporter/rubrerythrin